MYEYKSGFSCLFQNDGNHPDRLSTDMCQHSLRIIHYSAHLNSHIEFREDLAKWDESNLISLKKSFKVLRAYNPPPLFASFPYQNTGCLIIGAVISEEIRYFIFLKSQSKQIFPCKDSIDSCKVKRHYVQYALFIC